MAELIRVYNSRTGRKHTQKVPAYFLELYPHLKRVASDANRASKRAPQPPTAPPSALPVSQTPPSAADSTTPTSGPAAPSEQEN
jgi:hypothetical protein